MIALAAASAAAGTSLLIPGYLGKLAPPGSETPPRQRSNGEQPQGALASERRALSVRGNEAKPRVIRQNENPVRACDVGAPRAGSREPSGVGEYEGVCYGGSVSQTHGRARRFLTEHPARTAHRAFVPENAGPRPPRFLGPRSPAPRLRPF